ncbi:hypothetical protein POM88_052386 [Heracleum sosnowskyi]|uniref:Uncharacterized protein n=1 Tax=Heracleum sosnowskyi TaxID=360622 RepID=A0AAD8LXX5_9APIA|nr:hypothetical protein POM88_052386 [Heracleum sosnowskyi]
MPWNSTEAEILKRVYSINERYKRTQENAVYHVHRKTKKEEEKLRQQLEEQQRKMLRTGKSITTDLAIENVDEQGDLGNFEHNQDTDYYENEEYYGDEEDGMNKSRSYAWTVAVKIRINKNRIKADGQLDINL